MKKIMLLLLEGCETLEFSPFIDIFGWNDILSKEKIQVTKAGISNSLNTSWGLTISSLFDLSKNSFDINEYQALVIPGGFGKYKYFTNIDDPLIYQVINKFIQNNKIIISICTASIILGELGFLKNIRSTTYLQENDRYFSKLTGYGAIPVRDKIVKDKNIFTSSDPSTSLLLGFHLLSLLTSKKNTIKICENMGFSYDKIKILNY